MSRRNAPDLLSNQFNVILLYIQLYQLQEYSQSCDCSPVAIKYLFGVNHVMEMTFPFLLLVMSCLMFHEQCTRLITIHVIIVLPYQLPSIHLDISIFTWSNVLFCYWYSCSSYLQVILSFHSIIVPRSSYKYSIPFRSFHQALFPI